MIHVTVRHDVMMPSRRTAVINVLESISPNYPTKEGALLRVVRVKLAVIGIDTSQPTIIIGPRLITVTVGIRASNGVHTKVRNHTNH